MLPSSLGKLFLRNHLIGAELRARLQKTSQADLPSAIPPIFHTVKTQLRRQEILRPQKKRQPRKQP